MQILNSSLAATEFINALGIDLLRRLTKRGANTLLSPYSIQCALVQAYAGAEGETKTEMARVLHYSPDEVDIHRFFASLRDMVDATCRESGAAAKRLHTYLHPPPSLLCSPLRTGFSCKLGFNVRESFLNLLESVHQRRLSRWILLRIRSEQPNTSMPGLKSKHGSAFAIYSLPAR